MLGRGTLNHARGAQHCMAPNRPATLLCQPLPPTLQLLAPQSPSSIPHPSPPLPPPPARHDITGQDLRSKTGTPYIKFCTPTSGGYKGKYG